MTKPNEAPSNEHEVLALAKESNAEVITNIVERDEYTGEQLQPRPFYMFDNEQLQMFASKLRAKDAATIAQLKEELGDGTTGNKYRAELYDEVWNKARKLGYANVADALEEIASLKAQLAEAQKDCARMIAVFAHTHVSSNDGTDACKQCGLDLRNPVHFAAPTYKKE